jgi:hypothetical protein
MCFKDSPDRLVWSKEGVQDTGRTRLSDTHGLRAECVVRPRWYPIRGER